MAVDNNKAKQDMIIKQVLMNRKEKSNNKLKIINLNLKTN